jgi:asparagine synthase (glutamine-hydrolysing)
MCGIAVILKPPDTSFPLQLLEHMRDEVAHRGPDDKGLALFRRSPGGWAGVSHPVQDWRVGFGHRRLSILDLSSAGHQPMSYQDKFWVVHNGEIYNFIELRQELERNGHSFRSTSDTEVILAAFAEWGLGCFTRFRGMWGLVILDTVRDEVILCRDRIGIKPLYLWEGQEIVAVASEIKQFLHLPGFVAQSDSLAVAEYLQTGYENTDHCFFRGVRPVPAGTWLRISLNGMKASPAEAYWHPEQVQQVIENVEEAGRLFAEKLEESVRIHLRSDVPVGCALSGGLDSSAVAVLVNKMKGDTAEPLYTFTSTFPGDPTDEREYVDAVLSKIRAKSHFVIPEPDAFLADLDRFLWVHDEPVGSLSVYAAYSVARLAREAEVPVTLNGQGGDEVLSGYWQTYFLYLLSLLRRGRVLSLAGHFAGALMGSGNPDLITQVPIMLRRYRARRQPQVRLRLHSPLDTNSAGVLDDILALDGRSRRVYEIRAMFLPRLLKWEDRNSMAFAVEGRYAFLDHELIELCLSFSPETLFHQGWTKCPLRIGLKYLLPRKIVQRRTKFGFEVPQDSWLNGPLRPVLNRWLNEDRPLWEYVERQHVRRLAEQTWLLGGKHDEPGQALFRLFAFDRWLELFEITN